MSARMVKAMSSNRANAGSDSPQTFLTKVFKPGDKGLTAALHAESTVEVRIVQGPIRTPATREFNILEHGKRRIADPLTEPSPIADLKWALRINLREGWTQVRGKGLRPWKDDNAHKIILVLLKLCPHPIDRFDAGEALGKMKVSEGRFRSLMSEVRKIVGEEVLPERARALSKHCMIIIEGNG